METAKIYQALFKFQGLIRTVTLDSVNKKYGSKYASFPQIVKETNPILQECGLFFTQIFDGQRLITELVCMEDGSKIVSSIELPSTVNAQSMASAITYMKRYSLCAILGLIGEEDDDGNAAAEPRMEVSEVARNEARAASELTMAVQAIWAKFLLAPDTLDTLIQELREIAPSRVDAFIVNANNHKNRK